jgi:hypothetical protein
MKPLNRDFDVLDQIEITLGDSTGSRSVKLYCEIFDHSVARKWLYELKKTLNNPSIKTCDQFYGKLFYNESEILSGLQEAINTINSYIPNTICIEVGHSLDQNTLNDLHADFERIEVDNRYLGRSTPREVKNAIQEINHLVHKGEFILLPDKGGIIDICFSYTDKYPLKNEDFELFTPDNRFGGLYLTYGVTGVPPLAAFSTNPKNRPIPQSYYTSGFFMSLKDDFVFKQWDELSIFLKDKYGINAKDPRSAIGYIPIGRLNEPKLQSRDELGDSFHGLSKVIQIRILSTREIKYESLSSENCKKKLLQPARWPYSAELFHHLDLVPFLDLKLDFDYKSCLREAESLLQKFVQHRGYDQSTSEDRSGKWKSLGIRAIDGDSKKTLYHNDYGITQDPNYQLTEIASLCPHTLEFLNKITDIQQCQRIRFMLLEPGARIAVHSDAPNKEVCLAFNIALNMPPGCDFWIDVNPNGRHNSYSTKIPFFAGVGMLVNVAKYHYLYNNSDTNRIHLIVHGPIRFSDEDLLRYARQQNAIYSQSDLIQNLVRKYTTIGSELRTNSPLLQTWANQGLTRDCFPANIRVLIVADSKITNKTLFDELNDRITGASIFPIFYEIVLDSEVELWLNRNRLSKNICTVVFVAAGTYIKNPQEFTIELLRVVSYMNSSEITIIGEMLRPNENDESVIISSSICIIDFEAFKYSGGLDLFLGGSYNLSNSLFSMRLNSEPKFVLKDLPDSLKKQVIFITDKSTSSVELNSVRDLTKRFVEGSNKRVFFINTESLNLINIPGFRPDDFISRASGLKPASILFQYWRDRDPEQVSFIDFDFDSIKFIHSLAQRETLEEVVRSTIDGICILNKTTKDEIELEIRSQIKSQMDHYFDSNFDNLKSSLIKMRKARYRSADFLANPLYLTDLIRQGKKTLIWTSNVFDSNSAYFQYNRKELETKYLSLAKVISEKHGLKAWTHLNSKTLVFGKNLLNPEVVVTEGDSLGILYPPSFTEVI